MEGGKDFKWHLTAIVVVGIWGMTFISTRVLIVGHDVHFDPCADRERTYAAGDFPVALPHSLRGYLVHFASNIALPHVARRRLDAVGGRDGRFALFSDGEYRPRSDAYHKCGFYCL